MFRKLFDFGYRRSLLEAVGFYLFYSLIGLVILYLLNLYYYIFDYQIITLFTQAYCLLILILVLESKKALKKNKIPHPRLASLIILEKIGLIILSLFLSFFGGILVGMIPTLLVTTIKHLQQLTHEHGGY